MPAAGSRLQASGQEHNMSKTLIIVVLILIIIGLWLYPALTKTTLTGAFGYVKGLAANLGIIT